MKKDIYLSKIKKLLIYYSLITILLLLMKFFSEDYSVSLTGVIFSVSTIAIPCTFFYYSINKQKELFIYILFYISMLIERLTFLFFIKNNIIINYSLTTPFIFRTALISLIFFSRNKTIKFIADKNIISIFASIIISILLVLYDSFIQVNYFELKYCHLIYLFYFLILIYSHYILYKLLYKNIKEKNFIHTIYLFSIVILGFQIYIYIYSAIVNKTVVKIYRLENFFFALSFSILILGLFIEIKYLLIENKRLTKNVETISNDIKEIKVLENVRGQFFANISHELKTPLNIIYSCIQLLNSKNNSDLYSLGKEYTKYSSIIKQNCHRMIRLINNIVDINKIDSGFLKMNFHNYDIVSLVENITLSTIPYTKFKNIEITFDTLIEELEICCDSDSIERIILNILSNSIKFTHENGKIFVSIDSNEDFVTIKIIDDGIGIEKEKHSLVFEPFVQIDRSLTQKREGSGIGLSLVRSLVSLHNGEISLESEINEGTAITIKLPNKKLEYDNISSTKLESTLDDLVTKINIEFSDIYNNFL